MVSIPSEICTNVRLTPRGALTAFLTPPNAPRPASEAALLAVADERAVLAGGIRAWSWGDGPTTLLVHGWGGRGTQLGALIPALVNVGRRVVAFDALAHGDSPGAQTTLPAMADALATTATWARTVDAIVAHSFGAAASTLALSRGLSARRVACVAPMFHVSASVERFLRTAGLTGPDRAAFLAALTDAARGLAPHDLDGVHLAPARREPLLVVHDRNDREVPFEHGLAAATTWPDARLITTEGLGHRRILDDAHVVSLIREFVLGRDLHSFTLDEAFRIERDLADREGRWERLAR